MDHCRECEKAEYGGAGSEGATFSTSDVCDVGEEFFVEQTEMGRETSSAMATVDAGVSLESITRGGDWNLTDNALRKLTALWRKQVFFTSLEDTQPYSPQHTDNRRCAAQQL